MQNSIPIVKYVPMFMHLINVHTEFSAKRNDTRLPGPLQIEQWSYLSIFDSDLFINKRPAIFERAAQGVTKAADKTCP